MYIFFFDTNPMFAKLTGKYNNNIVTIGICKPRVHIIIYYLDW